MSFLFILPFLRGATTFFTLLCEKKSTTELSIKDYKRARFSLNNKPWAMVCNDVSYRLELFAIPYTLYSKFPRNKAPTLHSNVRIQFPWSLYTLNQNTWLLGTLSLMPFFPTLNLTHSAFCSSSLTLSYTIDAFILILTFYFLTRTSKVAPDKSTWSARDQVLPL